MRETPRPVRMPWTPKEVPHGIIEVNQSCNIACHGCYKVKSSYQKPLADIWREVDLLAEQRNLSAITLAGGEPTMHPDLDAVIAYIAGKGIVPAMLTNATLLTPELAAAYRRAGLVRVFLHIDADQKGRDDGDPAAPGGTAKLREHYIGLCHDAGLDVALAVTLYKNAIDAFLETYEQSLADPRVDRILVTNYAEALNAKPRGRDDLTVTNAEVRAFMRRSQGMEPAWFLPSSHDDDKHRWLFYIATVSVDRAGKVHRTSLHPNRRLALAALPRLSRLLEGKFRIEGQRGALRALVALWLYSALSLWPPQLARAALFTLRALCLRNARQLVTIFQEGPTPLADGAYETCRDCPDATIRNGKLVPVCLADRIAPLSLPITHEATA